MSRRYVVIAITGLMVCRVAFGRPETGVAAQATVQAPPTPVNAQAAEDAFRKGGFRAAAAVAGHYVQSRPSMVENGPPLPLSTLFSGSDLVIVGIVQSDRGILSPDGQSIRTHYRVRVTEAFKGETKPGAIVTVSVLGGRVPFEDGSWAQLNIKLVDMPVRNRRYAFFLKHIPNGDPEGADLLGNQLWPFRGELGVIEVPVDGSAVRPADSHRGRPDSAFTYRHANAEQFLKELRAVAGRGRK